MTDPTRSFSATKIMPRHTGAASAVPASGMPSPEPLGPAIERQLAACRRNGTMLAVLSMSLHGLDAVRHCHGEAVEEQLRQAAWARLQSRLRGSDRAVRVGQDEFGAVLLNAGRLAAGIVEARLAGALCEPYGIGALEIVISIRAGTAVFPHAGSTGEGLADAAARSRGFADGRTAPVNDQAIHPGQAGDGPSAARLTDTCTTP